jgi:hypothetical protein
MGERCDDGTDNDNDDLIDCEDPDCEGQTCNDSQYCNQGETCQSGVCTGGGLVDCDDGVGCTDDSCNEIIDACENIENCPEGMKCNKATNTCEDHNNCTDLISVYHLDGNGEDSHGDNDGVLIGGVDCNVQGIFGQACRFDGVDDYISLASAISFNNDDDYTIAFWLSTDDISDWVGVLGPESSWDSFIVLRNDERLSFYDGYDGGGVHHLVAGILSINEWHHAVLTSNSGEMRWYLDGTHVTTTTTYDESTSISALGSKYSGASIRFKGMLDEVAVYGRALSDDEVAELYNATLSCGSTTCTSDVDCNDGVGCTDDSCNEATNSCDNEPNDTNCPDDGEYCNGTEYCDAVNDCSSPGDPCLPGEICNETADTCEEITAAREEFIIDNGDTWTSFIGSWYLSGGPDPYGTNSLFADAAGATYTFEYPFPGEVMVLDVYQWWTYYSNRCIDTRIEISDSIGLLGTLSMNQRENVSQWYYYNTYLFEEFARVSIISEGGCSVNADAVRLVTVALSDNNCNGIDDDGDSIVDDDYVPNDTCGEGVCRTNNIPSSCVSGVETDCQPGIPTEATEISCGDGEDNDCDGLTDGDDGDCIVTDGLVGYWKFDEGEGRTVYDYSGHGNNGILVNDPSWATGKIGEALSFDGINNYVDFGDTIPTTSTLSAFAWIKHIPDSNDRCVLSRGGYSDGWRLCIDEDDLNSNPWIHVTCGSDTTPSMSLHRYDVNLTPNDTWVHVGWTWDGFTARVYLNGEEINIGSNANCTNFGIKDTPYHLKAGVGREQFYFNGIMDEVRIYDRALSLNEVKRIYDNDSGINPPPQLPPTCTNFTYSEWGICQPTYVQTRTILTTSPEGCEGGSPTTIRYCAFIPPESDDLIGYWKFDEGEGRTVYDYSGHGNNGIFVNDPSWATGKIGEALNFDGVDDYVYFDAAIPKTSTLSAFAWIKHIPDSNDRCVLSRGGYSEGWRLCIDQDDLNSNPWLQLTCGSDTTPSINIHRYDVQLTSSDTWEHIGWTWDGLTARLYLNGQEIGSGTNATCTDLGIKETFSPLTAGNGQYQFHFNGALDEIRLYDRALSADEVRNIYDSDSGTTH